MIVANAYWLRAFEEIPEGDGTSRPLDVADRTDRFVQIETAGAMATLQGTIDGERWLDILLVEQHTTRVIEVAEDFAALRVVVSGWTSGVTTAALGGRTSGGPRGR